MNDIDILAVGRTILELTFQREQLIQANRVLEAKVRELSKPTPPELAED